jgi:hypothetical protein
MTRTVFDNHGVAHVWAQNNQDSGRSSNGQFFFDGPALFSYGRHFLAGFIMPDGTALLNADSYSISTTRHQSYARSAVSHRARVMVPNLTPLYGALCWAARQAGDSRIGAPFAGAEAEAIGERFKAEAARWAVDTFAARVSYGSLAKGAEGLDALPQVLAFLGLGRNVAQVTRDIKAHTRKAEAEAARLEAEGLERDANNAALIDARDIAQAQERGTLEDMNRRLLKAQKWTKGRKGFLRKHDAIKAARAQVRALIALDAKRAERKAARAAARNGAAALRAGLEALKSGTLEAARVRAFAHGAGVWGAEGDAQGDGAEAQNARERAAYLVAQGVAQVLEGAPLGVTMRGTLEALKAEAAPLAEAARDARTARAQERAEARERERLERERATRESWLEGDKAARFYGRDAQGGAYLRAVDVTRDDSGNVTGGTLETSQGAQVPLAHALRVFRFLKWCRDTGTPWHRNGRVIRVGFYQVDSVDSDGSFRAGCHRINWPQVAALAERLGVADLAPDSSVATPSGAAA